MEIGAERAELAHGVDVDGGPPGTGLFEARLEDVAVTAFDQTGADGQVVGEGRGIVELVGAIAQIAQRGAHGGLLVRAIRWLLAWAQGREDGEVIAGAQGLAQRSDKGLGVGRIGRGGGEVVNARVDLTH